MRIFATLALILGLAACQTTVNAPGPASPLLMQAMDEIVSKVNEDRGQAVGTDLINAGATSEGNTLIVTYQARNDLARDMRAAPRGEVQSFLNGLLRRRGCSDPDIRTFLGIGGRMELRFVDEINRTLAVSSLSGC